MPAGTAAVSRRARRPVSMIMIGATVLGLWFGFTAPDTSPVVEPPVGTATTLVVAETTGIDDAGGTEADADGGRAGGRDGEPG